MADERKKPGRATSHWDDEKRASGGRDRRRNAHPFGYPTVEAAPATPVGSEDSDGKPSEDSDGVTSPVELLGRELTDEEIELAASLGVEPSDPVPFGQVLKLLARINAIKLDERRHDAVRAQQILDVNDKQGPPVARLDSLELKMRIVWALLGAAGTAAGGSLIAAGKGLYERGAFEGALILRVEHLERDLSSSRDELRQLRDRRDDRGARRDQPDRTGSLLPAIVPFPKGPTTP